MVHSCPRCELRFRTSAEVKEHLSLDHGAPVEGWGERYRYPASHPDAPLYEAGERAGADVRHYLVVANQTLAGEELRAFIEQLARQAPAAFHVVVPATHSGDMGRTYASVGGPPAPREADEEGSTQAQWRLRKALDVFRELRLTVNGEVGPSDPLAAIGQVLQRERIDEIVISTLPEGASRWLGMDLPRRVQQRFKIPVRTVVAPA